MSLLEIDNITKSYAGHNVLDGVSLRAESGRVHGLIGPNGAGKTTLLRVVNRIVEPDGGEVRLDGHSIGPEDVNAIGYLPEERGLYPRMKVGEQAVYFARLRGLSRSDAESAMRTLFDRFGITNWWDRRTGDLSKGMQQLVQFAVAVAHKPRLLILDEPFSGFDAAGAEKLTGEIRRLVGEGTAVLLSTHNLYSAEELCSSVTIINHGKAVLDGNAAELCSGGKTLKQIFLETTAQ